jgi:hypothetical protein
MGILARGHEVPIIAAERNKKTLGDEKITLSAERYD